MLVASSIEPVRRPVPPPFAESEFALLNRFRERAARARSARRMDLFGSCALLSGDKAAAASAYADALLRALRSGLGRTPVFFKPGEREVSDDEAWLLRLVLSVAADDRASARFLVGRMVAPATLRPILFLASGLAARLDGF